jgi:N-methylhydantoinase B
MAELSSRLGLAETGSCLPPSIGVISGIDPRTAKPYVNEVYLGITGGAGAPGNDGWLTIVHVGNAGGCFQDSIELDELRQPIFVAERRLLADSEGAGEFRGASSAYAVYGPTLAPMQVAYVSDGTINAPRGARGGGDGGRADQFKVSADGRRDRLPNCAEVWLQPGEMIASITTGGGGYGDPRKRDVERVRFDVVEKWITRERAREVYGVVVDLAGKVDAAETSRLRAGKMAEPV